MTEGLVVELALIPEADGGLAFELEQFAKQSGQFAVMLGIGSVLGNLRTGGGVEALAIVSGEIVVQGVELGITDVLKFFQPIEGGLQDLATCLGFLEVILVGAIEFEEAHERWEGES